MSRPEVLFDGIADRIALEISKARDSIYVAVAWLSNEKLFNALVKKAKEGVMVRLMISNDEQTQKNSQKLDYKILNGFGDSDVSLVNPDMGGLMHNKLCIIDRLTVITGSYNWTYYADNKNHENIFIFQDGEVAETCIRHFKHIVNHYLEVKPKPYYPKPHHKNHDKNKNNHQTKANTPSPQSADVSTSNKPKEQIIQEQPKPQPPETKQEVKKSELKNLPQAQTKEQSAREYFEIAQQHEKNKNKKLAFEYYKRSAQLGNAVAQLKLGFMYEYGEGVTQDYAKAAEWYTKSAKQGDGDAQNNLGFMYEYGNGVAQDYAKAMEWYTKSANQGSASAQFSLGCMYRHGKGVVQDDDKAIEWFTKSAKQGNEYARDILKGKYGITI